jgi:hypothetical protein
MIKFIVAVDDVSAEQRDAITRFFREQNFGWWHWLSDTWLLYADQTEFTTATLRDRIFQIAPTASVLVQNLNVPGDWALAAVRESHEWMHRNWRQ